MPMLLSVITDLRLGGRVAGFSVFYFNVVILYPTTACTVLVVNMFFMVYLRKI